jgi:8-oxo-dGTP pyrophosphatase MutT (NUDIX family)
MFNNTNTYDTLKHTELNISPLNKHFLNINNSTSISNFNVNINNVCNNCGRGGHLFQQCKLPITSYGIIVFRFLNSKEYLNKEIEYLMIRRKDSFGYIDFIRGKYSPYNIVHLQNIIDEMSIEEKNRLMSYSFSDLWIMMWGEKTNIQYRHEEALSLKKFELIKNGVVVNNEVINLEMLIKQSSTNWTETEWEFPKGRRNNKEKDLACAMREFEEETGLIIKNTDVIEQHLLSEDTNINSSLDENMDESSETNMNLNTNAIVTFHNNRFNSFKNDKYMESNKKTYKPTRNNEQTIYIIENILPLEETFIGTNNKLYKHKYFLAFMENEEHDLSNFQKTEVSKLEWKSLEKCIESIRPYCYEKKKLIRNINSLLVEYKIYK